jgi:adenine-specific DNA-methyltransferase
MEKNTTKTNKPKKKINEAKIIAKYIHGNASKKLDELIKQKKKFRLIISSPPYNMDREYEKTQHILKYKDEIKIVIAKLVKLLDDKGSICWQVGNYIDPETKEVIPLDIIYHELFKEHNLFLRNRIIWHFEHGLHASQRFSGRYETIMWYTKSSNYTFNLDDVRIPAKYPGKTYYKGEKKGQFSGNPKGKNPSDVWKIVRNDWEKEIWNIPNVKANHKEKTTHPCQYPVELIERCVLALTKMNDWVLDPYAGVASSLIAALKNGRNSIGIEKYKRYLKVGEQRIKKFRAGELKLRELGKPVFVPNPNMTVAKKPGFFLY